MYPEKATACFIGIDVSKDTLDIFARPTMKSWKTDNREFQPLVQKLKRLNPELIVLEATGGYETGILTALKKAGLPVYREHTLKVYHHAKGRGKLAKANHLDTSTLAHYAECFASEIVIRELPSPEHQALQQLVARRKQLVEWRTAEISRNQHPSLSCQIQDSCRRLIDVLNEQIKVVETTIQEKIQANQQWQRRK